MFRKLWSIWLHPQTQEVVGVIFFLLAIHDAVQHKWPSVICEVLVVFSAVQIIRRSNK